MRKLILFLLVFASAKLSAQVYQEMPQYGYRANRMAFDSTLQIPTVCGVPTLKSIVKTNKNGAIAYDSCNAKFYVYNPKTQIWAQISGGSGGGVDSIRRVSDSVFAWISGIRFFQFKDSVGGSGISGTGSQYYLPKFSNSTTLQNSQIFDSVNVGINTTSPAYKLDVNGTGKFRNDLYADSDLVVNNYFAINTTATDFPIPDGNLGIWRRKGNGFGTYFLEDEQGNAKDKWAFVKREGYNQLRDWFKNSSSIVNINYGWGNPNQSNLDGNTLLIDPKISIGNSLNTNTKIRGIYYNPTLDSLVNTKHIAFESTSGNIVMKGLKTSNSTTDSIAIWINDTLSKAPYPSGGGGIDTLKRSSDSVYARKNGNFIFQFKDSVGTNPAPVGYYGAFQDTIIQTLPLANTAYPIKARITDLSNGVFLADSTRFVFNNAGIYNLQWSGQFQNINIDVQDARIWVKKNNVDIIGTTGLVSIPKRKTLSEYGHTVTGWNFLLEINAGDTLQFYWAATSTDVSLHYYPLGTVPPSPTTASMVVTITQQSGIMAGTGITGLGTSGNLQSGANQTLATSATGNDFTITSASNIQTFNLPVASATTTGKLSSSNWTTFNNKLNISDTSTMLSSYSTRINGKLNISDANQALTAYQYLGSTIKAFPIGVTGFANATVSYAHVSTRMMLVAIYIPQTTTITGVKYIVTSAGVSYVGNANYNGFVLYDYNKSTGLCTRIDSTASDNTIWTTTGTQQKAFVTPISLPQGVYYLGVMCQGTATTFPGIAQNTALLGASTFDLTSPARITAQLTGANVPASFNLSTSALNTNLPILMLY